MGRIRGQRGSLAGENLVAWVEFLVADAPENVLADGVRHVLPGDEGVARAVAIAARLLSETAVMVKWIAERWRMGARGHVNHLLYRQRKEGRE
jgi:hypothetical protein